jgi:hypothetical protein
VTRVGLSTRDSGRRVMELIRRVPGANMLGVVANDAHEVARRYPAYGSG